MSAYTIPHFSFNLNDPRLQEAIDKLAKHHYENVELQAMSEIIVKQDTELKRLRAGIDEMAKHPNPLGKPYWEFARDLLKGKP